MGGQELEVALEAIGEDASLDGIRVRQADGQDVVVDAAGRISVPYHARNALRRYLNDVGYALTGQVLRYAGDDGVRAALFHGVHHVSCQ